MEELYKEEIEYQLKDQNKKLILSAKSIEDIVTAVRFSSGFIWELHKVCMRQTWGIYKIITLTRELEPGVEATITVNKKIPVVTLTPESGELKIEYHN